MIASFIIIMMMLVGFVLAFLGTNKLLGPFSAVAFYMGAILIISAPILAVLSANGII